MIPVGGVKTLKNDSGGWGGFSGEKKALARQSRRHTEGSETLIGELIPYIYKK